MDTNLGREDFNHTFKFVIIAENNEKGPYKKYTDEDCHNTSRYANENGLITDVTKFCPAFSNLNGLHF